MINFFVFYLGIVTSIANFWIAFTARELGKAIFEVLFLVLGTIALIMSFIVLAMI